MPPGTDNRQGYAAAGAASLDLMVRRNCSASPGFTLLCFALAGLAPMAIAVSMAAAGVWMVLPFAGLELAALCIAFRQLARHATDHERISLAPGRLEVAVHEGGRVLVYSFNPGWARIVVDDGGRQSRLFLSERGRCLEIGRHWDERRRSGLESMLRRYCGSGSKI